MADADAIIERADNAFRSGNIRQAEALCEEALKAARQDLRPRFMLAHIALNTGRAQQAVEILQEAAMISSNSYEVWLGLGNACLAAHETGKAIAALERAAELNPKDARAFSALGHAEQEAGNFDRAVSCLERAIQIDPKPAWPYLGLVLAKKITSEDRPMIARIESRLSEGGLSGADRSTLEYALSKAYDDLGDAEKALSHADRATEERIRLLPPSRRFDPAANEAGADFTIRTFSREFLADNEGKGNPSALPLFIVGAPRSGTTLLEQMLSNHPDIGAGGEISFWQAHGPAAFEAIKTNSAHAREIVSEYLAVLERMRPGQKHVTDKMPTNYTMLGIFRVLLPNARILYCRRNPVDTCLSLYLNAHSISEMPFGYTRAEIVEGYLAFERVMEHWKSVLPQDRFLEVHYESLVSEPESSLRSILAFLGLPWDEACLHPERNERDVNTPSRWQVRQPIYRKSVDRWRKYENWLGEFIRLKR